jgi:NADH-quinone oxidoreductase subunit E
LCLLIAFILGAIIGWLWRHITCKKCQDELADLAKQLENCQNKLSKTQSKTTVAETAKAPEKIIKKQVIKKDIAKVADVKSEVKTESSSDGSPVFLQSPRNSKADDLKRIKGIGKVLEGILFDKGVYHFDQIANWSQSNATWMDTFMKFPGRIEREGWIKQANLLAKGKETDFSKKVDKNKIYD